MFNYKEIHKKHFPPSPWNALPLGGPRDIRVYMVNDFINAVLGGQDLSKEHRNTITELGFPTLIELLDYVKTLRVNPNPSSRLARYHASPGPEATVETFSAAILAGFKAIEEGNVEVVDDIDD